MVFRGVGRPLALAALLGLVLITPGSGIMAPARADDPPADAPKDAAPDAAAAAPAAEPERIEGKLLKVDLENKTITVMVSPEKGKSGRAFKRYKLVLDDKSLIIIDQQPSTLAALEAGQKVDVGFFKRGKQEVVDTVVVQPKDED